MFIDRYPDRILIHLTMSSTEEDEPLAKKPKPMVGPPEEWNDFLELDEYPVPQGSVRAVSCRPWLTCPSPQDAKFDISFNGILRPYHTYKGDILPMGGLYFLKRYTRKFWKIKGKKATEEICLFDEVKCAFPTTTSIWPLGEFRAARVCF